MKKSLALLLALALIFAFPVTASAAETTEARVPVTLTVVNTVSPISCTVPAALPVSLVSSKQITLITAYKSISFQKPISGFSYVPTITPRSRNAFLSSQHVSGNKPHAWHAARFKESRP